MPYLLALASALLYGAGDFTGGLASRRAGTLPVVLLSQLSGLILLGLLLPILPSASPIRSDYLWGVAAGVTGGAGVSLLYYGLSIGRMAVVAPTTAVCAVVIPVLAALLMGERPPALAGAGIVLGIVSIVLVSQQAAEPGPSPAHPPAGRLPPGMVVALVSGVAIGLFFLALAQTRAEAGMYPVFVARGTASSFFAAAALIGRRSLRIPGVFRLTLLCGVVDMLANALYLLATRGGPLSIVVTLSSLYPASTVLLARVLLGERLSPRQVVGVGCALAAIGLIVGGGRG